MTTAGVYVVRQDDLPVSAIAHELVGDDHGGVGVCVILVDAPPGKGPSLHEHPYDEVFVVQAGRALFVAGDEEREVGEGEIVVVPAGTPHRFESTGPGRLRQVDIHVSPRCDTRWLGDDG